MRRIALMATVFAGLAISGCMTVAPMAGPAMVATGFSYTAGRASQDFIFPPDKVQPVVLAAMDDLRIHSVVQTAEPGVIHYEGTTADNRRAMVSVRPYAGSTRLTARIGWLGDEPLSRALMDRTGIRLGTLPPAPIPEKPPSKPGSLFREGGPDPALVREQSEFRFYDKSLP